MKIKSFKVTGLHGEDDIIDLNFNDDLNIFTGRNGAGKTSILKLMWYLISGNCDKAIAEIKFSYAELITDSYTLKVHFDLNDSISPLKSNLFFNKFAHLEESESEEYLHEIIDGTDKKFSWFLTQYLGSSFFMPTFRMIEGGFMTEKYNIQHDVFKEFFSTDSKENNFNDIEDSLRKLSKNLSRKDHKFITSISANDIDIFLVKKYAEIMRKVNLSQVERLTLLTKKINFIMSNDVVDKNEFESISKKLKQLIQETNSLKIPLNKLRKAISDFIPQFDIGFGDKVYFFEKSKNYSEDYEIYEEDIGYDIDFDMKPNFKNFERYEEVEEIREVEEIKEEDGPIEISEPLTLNNLSAGEKQLITFIAYNIFYSNTIFFIDEPELSLHADWQRILFRILLKQNPTNQFIVSTHSPFIYSKYPHNEICIDPDLNRGNIED